MIHPTAIVHRNAEIFDGCEIGPYCVVGERVILGPGCRLHSHVVMAGPTKIGRENEFFPFSSIGHKTQDLKYKGEPTRLVIGDHNVFRENVTVNRATTENPDTVIGHHNTILAYAHIAHDCLLGDHIVMSNNATLAGHVLVEDHSVIGGFTAIHQFCRIGRMAITGGCSKVVQDIPPFMMADGNPARVRTVNKVGLERNEVPKNIQQDLLAAYKLLYRESGLNIGDALEKVRKEIPSSEEMNHLCDFVTKSERGIGR